MIVYISSTVFLYIFYNCYEYKNKQNKQNKNSDYYNLKSNSVFSEKYIIVNKTKSYILAVLTPLSYYYAMIFLFNFDINNKQLLDIIGAVYAATDMSAMIYNRSCHKSTWIHHIIVQIFYYYYYLNSNDMETTLCKPICVYCCFSSMSYLVNYRLAIRNSNHRYEQIINDVSLIIYGLTCIINWFYQVYYIQTNNIVLYNKCIYGLVLLLIINDDIFLMKYLLSTFKINKYEIIDLKNYMNSNNKISIEFNKYKKKLSEITYYR